MTMRRLRWLLAAALVAACASDAPQPIAYDVDACAQCRMQITDTRYGAEIVTRRGKAVKFDAIECLTEYYKQAAAAGDVRSVWVIDFRRPGTFIPAAGARYLQVPGGKSPMGRGLLATATDEGVAELKAALGGTVMRWSDLQ